MLKAEWGADLITSWNKHDWIVLPQRVGAKLARLLGADADEVIASDSTTVNLFKVVSAALALQKERTVIISGAPAGLLTSIKIYLQHVCPLQFKPPQQHVN